jgi:hypothetical protein
MQEPSIIPDNNSGASSDTTHELVASTAASANALFESVKQKLLDVNNWHKYCGKASAVFQLTDEEGNKVFRPAQLGDHFKIDIPGPGSSTGEGNDWVQIEAIEHTINEETEVLAMRVRPTDNPQNNRKDVAHFFTDEASSTFSVAKQGNKIVAAVNGRNEKPNVKAHKLIDKVRNAVIATTAILGLNKPQWKSLVKALLDE